MVLATELEPLGALDWGVEQAEQQVANPAARKEIDSEIQLRW